ncbi:MAG: cytochrome c biogenesis protein CcdA [Armatimonadota bacterium]|nr:cytochrome c biogenesis protein CcdA [Armatimonadota bacterium]MDR7402520.1 cytochrome c biogenesis protein CcdA [Armatimonadota bacterium]MDR7403702.1 cytochrome c biogenesis protein CcdA [Armatimonadota bacterium]MDR7436091.1 cytochrome c biogenesis protein CcdA [Armatimonadota bacterium]MDR7471970.1 cytochrome c biogenesis protein CcdA [Armatimonadota bacterium]
MSEVSVVIAFAAGVLGFASPCIVPLIPGYLSFVSGISLHQLAAADRRAARGRVLAATALFVVGFAAVFTALGASASWVGGLVLAYRLWLGRIGGAVIVLLGLAVLGVIRIPWLWRERRLSVRPPAGLLGACAVGMAFGFAWTPCVGPVLAAILTLAATSPRVSDGALLLLAYSLGLGLPFLATAALLTSAVDALGWIRRHSRAIEVVSGGFLVLMGVALMFDLIFRLNAWILRLAPFRPPL